MTSSQNDMKCQMITNGGMVITVNNTTRSF